MSGRESPFGSSLGSEDKYEHPTANAQCPCRRTDSSWVGIPDHCSKRLSHKSEHELWAARSGGVCSSFWGPGKANFRTRLVIIHGLVLMSRQRILLGQSRPRTVPFRQLCLTIIRDAVSQVEQHPIKLIAEADSAFKIGLFLDGSAKGTTSSRLLHRGPHRHGKRRRIDLFAASFSRTLNDSLGTV